MKKENIYDYHLMDAREISSLVPKNTVDVTITSPPYGNLKNYEKGVPKSISTNQIGFKQKYEDYLDDLQSIFKGVFNVTKNSGSLWLIVDTFSDNGKLRLLPFDLIKKLEEVGWKLKDIVIWNKVSKATPWSRKGNFKKIFEYILFFVKSKDFKYEIDRIKDPNGLKNWWIKYPERYNPRGKTPTDIWDFEIPSQGSWGNDYLKHFCPFPPKLVERILLLTTNKNQVVLDTFSGSGVVLAAAKAMGRKFIGFDINQDYIKNFYEKVLPKIQEELKDTNKDLNLLTRQSLKKKSEIKKLRQLKYPKVLIKKILDSRGEGDTKNLPLYSVFIITKDVNNLDQELFLVFNGKVDFGELYEKIKKIVSNPSLSRFGVKSKILAYSKEDFIKVYQNDPKFNLHNLWLYKKGITNVFERSISLSEWINDFQTELEDEKIPPIISNIKIDIPTDEEKKRLTRFL